MKKKVDQKDQKEKNVIFLESCKNQKERDIK